MQEKEEIQNFDMTIEECRTVFDNIDGLVIVDAGGKIKYLSPKLIPIIEKIEGKKIHGNLIGRHIEEVHPTSKICMALKTGKEERTCFYFSIGVTNIARIKPVYQEKHLIGAIDYDLFFDNMDLKIFLDKIVQLSLNGFLNLSETIETIMEGSKKLNKVKYCVSDIIGESDQMRDLRRQIHDLSESESTVMILGSTGCGKELVAHSIHNISRRRGKSMIEINCAAIPENLVESELFGYEEGTFTGANKGGKIGKFEMADKGTIFLDEVDQLPYHIQPKLLRVLQEKEICRIGGKTRPINIRVIAATNKNLKNLVSQGKFREDLYYRLNVVEIRIPLLAERKKDIPLLANHQLKHLNSVMGKQVESIADEVLQLFYEYDWPGNVRELNNILERAMNRCRGNQLTMEHFDHFFLESVSHSISHETIDSENPLERVRDLAEKSAILKALSICQNNRSKTARLLKISRTSLYYKMQKFNIE